MRVLLDTNFLIDIVRFKVDLDMSDLVGIHELATLSSVLRELTKISKEPSSAAMCAKVALKLIKEHGIKILKSEARPDDAMLKFADRNVIIATNDIELRKRLKALGRKTIYLKSKKHLAIS